MPLGGVPARGVANPTTRAEAASDARQRGAEHLAADVRRKRERRASVVVAMRLLVGAKSVEHIEFSFLRA